MQLCFRTYLTSVYISVSIKKTFHTVLNLMSKTLKHISRERGKLIKRRAAESAGEELGKQGTISGTRAIGEIW